MNPLHLRVKQKGCGVSHWWQWWQWNGREGKGTTSVTEREREREVRVAHLASALEAPDQELLALTLGSSYIDALFRLTELVQRVNDDRPSRPRRPLLQPPPFPSPVPDGVCPPIHLERLVPGPFPAEICCGGGGVVGCCCRAQQVNVNRSEVSLPVGMGVSERSPHLSALGQNFPHDASALVLVRSPHERAPFAFSLILHARPLVSVPGVPFDQDGRQGGFLGPLGRGGSGSSSVARHVELDLAVVGPRNDPTLSLDGLAVRRVNVLIPEQASLRFRELALLHGLRRPGVASEQARDVEVRYHRPPRRFHIEVRRPRPIPPRGLRRANKAQRQDRQEEARAHRESEGGLGRPELAAAPHPWCLTLPQALTAPAPSSRV